MDLAELEIFRCVVEAGGISRAAERLRRVPSNVTTRVKQLEQELGAQLFLREGKKLRLSPEGEVLLGYAGRILGLAKEAREALGVDSQTGFLRLGSMESTAAVRLPKPLAEFHRTLPGVALELRTGPTGPLRAQVLHGELDAALIADQGRDARLEKMDVFEEELAIIAGAGHPAIKSSHGLANITALSFATGCAYRQRLEDWIATSGQQADKIVEVGSYHAIIGCVIAGMGVALVPRAIIAALACEKLVSVHPLPPECNRSQTSLIWRKGGRSRKIEALGEILLNS
jgi:DNA-binding transcriptional LysR family regulator